MSGKPWSEARKARQGEFIRRRWAEGRYANRTTQTYRAKCREAAKTRYARPEERAKTSVASKKAWASGKFPQSIRRRAGTDMIRSTRAQAIARGADKYFTGRPCHRGHLSVRYISSRRCIDCILEDNEKLAKEYLPHAS